MTHDEMETIAQAKADAIVTDAWGEEELFERKDAEFYKQMWLMKADNAKRLRGEA